MNPPTLYQTTWVFIIVASVTIAYVIAIYIFALSAIAKAWLDTRPQRVKTVEYDKWLT